MSSGTVAMDKSKLLAKSSYQMANKGMTATMDFTKAGASKGVEFAKTGMNAAANSRLVSGAGMFASACKAKLWGAIGKSLSNDKRKKEDSKVEDELVWSTSDPQLQ